MSVRRSGSGIARERETLPGRSSVLSLCFRAGCGKRRAAEENYRVRYSHPVPSPVGEIALRGRPGRSGGLPKRVRAGPGAKNEAAENSVASRVSFGRRPKVRLFSRREIFLHDIVVRVRRFVVRVAFVGCLALFRVGDAPEDSVAGVVVRAEDAVFGRLTRPCYFLLPLLQRAAFPLRGVDAFVGTDEAHLVVGAGRFVPVAPAVGRGEIHRSVDLTGADPESGEVILFVGGRSVVHVQKILAHVENDQHRTVVAEAVFAVHVLGGPVVPYPFGDAVPVGQRMGGRIADEHDETHAQLVAHGFDRLDLGLGLPFPQCVFVGLAARPAAGNGFPLARIGQVDDYVVDACGLDGRKDRAGVVDVGIVVPGDPSVADLEFDDSLVGAAAADQDVGHRHAPGIIPGRIVVGRIS